MTNQKSRTVIFISLIIIGAFILAIGADICITHIGKSIYPIKYEEYVSKYSKAYNVPEHIVYSVIKIESDFDPNAVSGMGAIGLMQMMPDTFTWLSSSEHLNENLPVSSLYDPEVSIRYGVYYLNYLQRKFGNWETTLAAYNGGEGNVAKWLKNPMYSDGHGNITKFPREFKETKNYVFKAKLAMNFYKITYFK